MNARKWLAAIVTLFQAGSRFDAAHSFCPAKSITQELLPSPVSSTTPDFPTSNRLLEADISRIKEMMAADASQPPPETGAIKAMVSFYYSPSCPYSKALRPVMECLPKFFPPSLKFVAVDHSQLPSTVQLNNGILSTPVVRVSSKGKRWKFDGQRRLEDLIQFVEMRSGVSSVADTSALDSCMAHPACACAVEALPVTPADIAELGNNRWMLLALLFLAFCGGQALFASYNRGR